VELVELNLFKSSLIQTKAWRCIEFIPFLQWQRCGLGNMNRCSSDPVISGKAFRELLNGCRQRFCKMGADHFGRIVKTVILLEPSNECVVL
jgi:hypothetical protein